MIKVNRKIGNAQVSFTPARYKTVIQQYKLGVYRELIEMMKTATYDSHVAGCLLGRRAGFQREFTIAPFSDSAADKERVEWLQMVFDGLNMRGLFKSIHEAILYKFKVIDFNWEVLNNRQTPIAFTSFDQKYFRYDPKTNYEVLKIDNGKSLDDIPADALVCESGEMPVMLPVLRDYILKEFGLESWASFIETFGEPWIIGKYPAGATDDFKSELDDALTALAMSSRGKMPQDANIEIKETTKTTGDHEKFKDTCDRGISISLLGHENAVKESSGLQVGENISSYRVKREIAVDDMFFIDAEIQRLIRNIFDRNFGDGKYPKFQMDKAEPRLPQDIRDNLDLAYRHGVKIPIKHYKELGVDVYDDQEFVEREPSLF